MAQYTRACKPFQLFWPSTRVCGRTRHVGTCFQHRILNGISDETSRTRANLRGGSRTCRLGPWRRPLQQRTRCSPVSLLLPRPRAMLHMDTTQRIATQDEIISAPAFPHVNGPPRAVARKSKTSCLATHACRSIAADMSPSLLPQCTRGQVAHSSTGARERQANTREMRVQAHRRSVGRHARRYRWLDWRSSTMCPLQ